jgi:hypothetical protein
VETDIGWRQIDKQARGGSTFIFVITVQELMAVSCGLKWWWEGAIADNITS